MRKAIFFSFLVFEVFSFLNANAQFTLDFGSDSPLRKLQTAETMINNYYVEDVDEDKLVEDAIRGMLEKLDPHSAYTDPKETKRMTEPLAGDFEGIGVQFNILEDTLVVVQTISGGPSEKAGIIGGDRIVSVNDTAIAGVKMSREDIMSKLRGKKGTKAKLGIIRQGIKGTLFFTVKRDKIPLRTINAAYMLTDKVGVVRIESFGAKTYKEFVNALDSLQKVGMKDLILDLRDNSGGYLNAAVDIANEFLGNKQLIVYTDGRKVKSERYLSDGTGSMQDCKVVVLINEYSASASEIVTGAIQDHDRGFVVGRRSYGKGLVQRPLMMNDGSMIRLTVAHYYTPSGRCIQKPYDKGKGKDYARELEDRLLHGELTNADSIHFADSLKFTTLRLKRTVYGGGGIMPDEFVPLDTLKYPEYYRKLAAKSLIINATLRYVDANRKTLPQRYKTFESYNNGFTVPDEVIDGIFAEGEKQNIKPKDEEEKAMARKTISLLVKALVARDIWTMAEYYQVMNVDDKMMQRALYTIENKNL